MVTVTLNPDENDLRRIHTPKEIRSWSAIFAAAAHAQRAADHLNQKAAAAQVLETRAA